MERRLMFMTIWMQHELLNELPDMPKPAAVV